MSLNITSLNSGSNGNCYYIGNESEAVFIDAGLTCRETERRMKDLGLIMNKIKAIFLSHEHTDHIKGAGEIAEKYGIPVFQTKLTGNSTGLYKAITKELISFKEVYIGELCVTAFPKLHDAVDPHSFIVNHKEVTVGVFTDIGVACKRVIEYFSKCNAAFLEANYDKDLLKAGRYPAFLKNRISGGKGHLSNHEAFEVFKVHRSKFISHLFLSHLSKENNCPDMLKQLFNTQANGTEIIIASRFHPTKVYTITNSQQKTNEQVSVKAQKSISYLQMQLNFLDSI